MPDGGVPVGCRARIFDAHFHVIDSRFPLQENDGYMPPDFTCDDYLRRMQDYDLAGGAIVSGSFQAFDQSYLLAALQRLGPRFVGVTQVPANVTDAELVALDRAGVRGVRFNLRRGGSANVQHLDALARRVHEVVGWHAELYVAASELPAPLLRQLPAVSVDHLGLVGDGFDTLLELAAAGVRVKATGFGRVDFGVENALRALYAANPDALMFGTDLPSTRAPRAYRDTDVERVGEALGSAGAKRVLYDNARHFYRLPVTDR